MGLFESLLGAVISTAMEQSGKASSKMDKTTEDAKRMSTATLVRNWRGCTDPIKKAAYYREMQSRDDIGDYL